MTFINSLYLLGLIFSIVASAAVTSDTGVLDSRSPCAKSVHIIGTRGDSNRPPAPYGGLQTMVNKIKRRIPRNTNSSTTYPKHVPGTVKIGETHLRKSIISHVAQCPDTPIILAGYSKGAVVTLNAVCGDYLDSGERAKALPQKYAKHIIAINIYGDDARVPQQSYNRGTCQTVGTTPRTNADQCQPFASSIRSWCDADDPVCCLGGTNSSAHATYPERYDKAAVNFAVSQYEKLG